ncbi:MAG: hypothetical protein V3V82_02890, partial [Acidimicrobiia bacterium]
MTDQPTPPNLGNLTDAEFIALIDWSRTPANQPGPNGEPAAPDTWAQFNTCVVALLYRLTLENFRYLNKALACEVPTPLCTAAQAPAIGAPSLPTDYDATGAGVFTSTGLADQPVAIFPLNGAPFNIQASDRINSNSINNDLSWSTVVAHSGFIGAQHTVLG